MSLGLDQGIRRAPVPRFRLSAQLPLVFITYVSALHVVYGACLIASVTAGNATATANIVEHIPVYRWMVGLMLIGSALGAAWAVYFEWPPSARSLLLMFAQTLFLALAGLGAIDAVAEGHFADGVERSRYFILADQGHSIIAMVLHNCAVVVFHGKGARGLWRA